MLRKKKNALRRQQEKRSCLKKVKAKQNAAIAAPATPTAGPSKPKQAKKKKGAIQDEKAPKPEINVSAASKDEKKNEKQKRGTNLKKDVTPEKLITIVDLARGVPGN